MKQTKFLAMLFMAFAVAFSACTNVDDPDDPKDENGAEKLPFTEAFETGMGKFTAQSVVGEQKWEHSAQYKYVLISGYINASKTNVANEDWLISPEISLAGVTSAKLTFEHASRYFGDINNEATVWVSENYKDGLPATATWTKVTTPAFKDAGNWNMVSSGEISLKAFAGKNIRIALKYVSTDTKAGSWQLKNFKVEEGEATEEPVDPGTGAGTEATPYSVAAAMANQASATAWVKGYIVGSVKNDNTIATIASAADVVFGATNVRNTVVLIADSKTETDYTKCVAVNLPTGVIRDAVNLQDKPANLGKELTVNGVLRAYFGIPGVRDLISHKLEGATTEPPVTTEPNPATSLTENFESFTHGTGAAYFSTQANSKGWKGVKIQGTLEGDVRQFSNNKYVQFSAHRSSGVTAGTVQEFWVVSPRLDLTNATNKMLSFETAGAFFNATTEFEVYVLDSDNPATANKVKLEGWRKALATDLAAGQTYTPFISSGNIDLSAQTGIKRIGFYYKGTSGSGNSATYQLDNFKFGN